MRNSKRIGQRCRRCRCSSNIGSSYTAHWSSAWVPSWGTIIYLYVYCVVYGNYKELNTQGYCRFYVSNETEVYTRICITRYTYRLPGIINIHILDMYLLKIRIELEIYAVKALEHCRVSWCSRDKDQYLHIEGKKKPIWICYDNINILYMNKARKSSFVTIIGRNRRNPWLHVRVRHALCVLMSTYE